MRAHRTVVLPDYQGVGIGNALVEHIGDHVLSMGKRFTSVTSHPSMIHHRNRSNKWKLVRKPSHVAASVSKDESMRKSVSARRLTAGFEYYGDPKNRKARTSPEPDDAPVPEVRSVGMRSP